jgi:hypothetical protein
MKQKLFLCCCDRCRDYEIRILLKEDPKARRVRQDVVESGDTETLFIVNPNSNPELLLGFVIESWSECSHHRASEAIIPMLHRAVEGRKARK